MSTSSSVTPSLRASSAAQNAPTIAPRPSRFEASSHVLSISRCRFMARATAFSPSPLAPSILTGSLRITTPRKSNHLTGGHISAGVPLHGGVIGGLEERRLGGRPVIDQRIDALAAESLPHFAHVSEPPVDDLTLRLDRELARKE